MPNRLFLFLSAFAYASISSAADPVRPVYTPPPASAVSSGSVIQIIISLLLVLGAIVFVAWVLKRINMPQNSAGSSLKVISGVAVGQRERIVLVEVKDTWLVVGVAPGQVTALHSMPKQFIPESDQAESPDADNKFKNWLKVVMEKRNAA
ncbi:MAG: flagellar biosynthetic protein FliO [Gallionellaceae bacterium]|jgi:flagellar protein FliO/FliZ